ncbi:MAG TPA: hypothetical protein VGJ96_09125 [Gemmatimonadaceae bacterium]|jgi:hypothetical protein
MAKKTRPENVGLNLGPLHQSEWTPPLHIIADSVLRQYASEIVEPTEGDFRFSLTTAGRPWRSQLVVHEHERVVVFYAYTDVAFMSATPHRVMSVIASLSEELVLGSFEYQADRHAVYFRSSCVLGKANPEKELDGLLNSSEWPLRFWNAAIPLVEASTVRPDEICSIALFKAGLVPKIPLSTAAMKFVLRVEE